MPEFTADPARRTRYRNFTFRIRWEGREVAGFSNVSALRRTTEVVEHREDAEKAMTGTSPGRSSYEAITLERGITHDPEFEKWAAHASRAAVRKDLLVDVHDEAGQKVLTYQVFRCWVSECQALPELDASGNAVAIERIRLENEGWERRKAAAEPSEPVI
ncbi:phage tail protein [Microbacterium thalassium]|uniref:Phage tail-like protein n=1 Tax=Microbacterium thalassium TaxID=362649 RepID=A0A7X0FMI3_9MICO|nr:phage tail protein [Microbacterium thalassium]MBB6389726.1 phage tail-like protein [Microbacterium thalassium]GLK24777.1 phage tail protein [Microbacterium thalassium]